MKTMKISLSLLACCVLAVQANAQTADADEQARRDDEARTAVEMRAAEAEMRATQAEMQTAQAEARDNMREAERQLAEAARRIAELSQQNLPRIVSRENIVVDIAGKPRLGVTIGGSDGDGPVEGVSVLAVTPGSPAEEAGLRAGDVITSINDEALSAATSQEANKRLIDFMRGVEEGDKLGVEYLRNGNVGKVELTPRVIAPQAYAWYGNGRNFTFPAVPEIHVAPDAVRRYEFAMPYLGGSWGDMELVELNEGLGRYFGTSKGLLVVSAPTSDEFKLQDGDVIESIDGREPTSVMHAMRILASYQPGEELELRIMRDKRRQTLKVEIPADRRSYLVPEAPMPPKPAAAEHPPTPPAPETRT